MSATVFYIGYFVPAFTLVPLVAGLIRYKQLSKPSRALLLYLAMCFVFNVVGSTLAELGINNLPGLHLYTIAEVVTLMLYFQYAFEPGAINKWIKAVMIIFPVICVINFSFFQSIYTFNTYTRPLGALIIIVFTAAYLARQGSFSDNKLIRRNGQLVASGFLIYFCSSLFQFVFSSVIDVYASTDLRHIITNLHATFVLIMYLLILWAIIYERPERQY